VALEPGGFRDALTMHGYEIIDEEMLEFDARGE
jgi:hypothetical protein